MNVKNLSYINISSNICLPFYSNIIWAIFKIFLLLKYYFSYLIRIWQAQKLNDLPKARLKRVPWWERKMGLPRSRLVSDLLQSCCSPATGIAKRHSKLLGGPREGTALNRQEWPVFCLKSSWKLSIYNLRKLPW